MLERHRETSANGSYVCAEVADSYITIYVFSARSVVVVFHSKYQGARRVARGARQHCTEFATAGEVIRVLMSLAPIEVLT